MMTHSQAPPQRLNPSELSQGAPEEHAGLAEGQWNLLLTVMLTQLTEAGAIAIVSCTVILVRVTLSHCRDLKRCHQ